MKTKKYVDEAGHEWPTASDQGLSKPTHTPIPWSIDTTSATKERPLVDVIGDEDCVQVASSVDEYDAAFIVRAVNSHEELLSLLKECYSIFQNDGFGDDRIRKAIEKAEGR